MRARCSACESELGDAARFCASCGAPVTAADRATVTAAERVGMPIPVGRLASSGSSPPGGLASGAIVAGRYRIVGLLGRGGMGEVYRADDLTLGQTVALKFLPRSIDHDAGRRERLYAEVRTARQVSHPNVCRVYDIGDENGRHFLSMEYIDGEDLASLLKRIGYLPSAKALELSRQLCSGLAAAHDKGVLHRDLKPANIMIDSRGRASITDFGLAVAADAAPEGDLAGTPAYMAPEQLGGQPASVRSDVYALGLVLYEIYTGQPAFKSGTLAELRAQKDQMPSAPSYITRDVDPAVERVIQQCLDRDPRQRPASARHVAVALPGGDALAAALAAGETPSPELVAASGTHEGLKPGTAWTLLAVFLASTAVFGVLGIQRNLMAHGMPDRPPEALIERSRQILSSVGHPADSVDSAYGFDVRIDSLQYMLTHDESPDRFHHLPPDIIPFWYREAPKPIERLIVGYVGLQNPTSEDPPLFYSGESMVMLDNKARLIELSIVPEQKAAPAMAARPVDWTGLFREAGFDLAAWTPVAPEWTPRVFADARHAWAGQAIDRPNVPLRVEAASYRGQPVSFVVIGPWTRAARMTPPSSPRGVNASAVVVLSVFGVLGAIGIVAARRNLRLGRGDRRGAQRLAVAVIIMLSGAWLLGEQHVLSIFEIYLAFGAAGWTLVIGGFVWILYLALEPYVRRSWPAMIVSWNRLLSGSVRDPLVGRDVLIGCAAGGVAMLLTTIGMWLPQRLGYPAENMPWVKVAPFLGTRHLISDAAFNVTLATFLGLILVFLLVVVRSVTRSQIAAIAGAALLVASGSLLQSVTLSLTIGPILAAAVLIAVVTARVGLVATITMALLPISHWSVPLAMQTSAWYSSVAMGQTGLVLALALFAFYTSLGGRPMLGRLPVE